MQTNTANVTFVYNSAQAAKLAYTAQFIESEDDSDLPALRDWVRAVAELPRVEQLQVIRDVGTQFDNLLDAWASSYLSDPDLTVVADILATNIVD